MDGDEKPEDAPRFDAVLFCDSADDGGQLGFWCPWCEAVHWHGAHLGEGDPDGHRQSHCVGDRRSPLVATGYELTTIRTAAAGADRRADATPSGLMVTEPPLRSMLARVADAFRTATVRGLLGVSQAAARQQEVVRTVKRHGSVVMFGPASWSIVPLDGQRVDGSGLLRLAAALYGLPVGVAAVRLLEAASWETFDARAALAIQRAVDDWIARGALKRERGL